MKIIREPTHNQFDTSPVKFNYCVKVALPGGHGYPRERLTTRVGLLSSLKTMGTINRIRSGLRSRVVSYGKTNGLSPFMRIRYLTKKHGFFVHRPDCPGEWYHSLTLNGAKESANRLIDSLRGCRGFNPNIYRQLVLVRMSVLISEPRHPAREIDFWGIDYDRSTRKYHAFMPGVFEQEYEVPLNEAVAIPGYVLQYEIDAWNEKHFS